MVSARTESVSGHPSVHVGPEFDPSPSDARLFGQMMQKKISLPLGILKKTMEPSAVTPSSSFDKLHSRPAGFLGDLSDHLKVRGERMASLVGAALVTRDPTVVNQVVASMTENGVEGDFTAKVLGKTVSAVDQLTKLN